MQDTPQKAAESSVTPLTQTILVVDDSVDVCRAMQKLLQRDGFASIGCLTGADALSKAVVGIDAAIVDIHLPDCNGLELSRKLRAILGEKTPIIILSGDTSIDTLRALPEAKATHFWSKPVNTSVLLQQLKEWIKAGAA